MKMVNRSIAVSAFVATFSLPTHAADTYGASGRINQVDAARHEVNITHGPIAGLGWPAMTMTFPVTDKAATKSLRAGQPVKFWLEQRGGRYVITRIEPANDAK